MTNITQDIDITQRTVDQFLRTNSKTMLNVVNINNVVFGDIKEGDSKREIERTTTNNNSSALYDMLAAIPRPIWQNLIIMMLQEGLELFGKRTDLEDYLSIPPSTITAFCRNYGLSTLTFEAKNELSSLPHL